jgi:hypothetical protein
VLVLDVLKRTALGQAKDITPEEETALGLTAGQLRKEALVSYRVRVCAFQAIGRAGSPEALDFLMKVRSADIGPDSTGQIWPAAQVAAKSAQLNAISDPVAKVQFLEDLLSVPRGGWGAVGHWAVEELCNSGSRLSIGIIHEAIRSRSNGQRDEDEIRFCEARINIVTRYPDRAKAIGSVLTTVAPVDDRLLWWAIRQLVGMHDSQADAELDRFSREVEKLGPGYQRLRVFAEEIRYAVEARAK